MHAVGTLLGRSFVPPFLRSSWRAPLFLRARYAARRLSSPFRPTPRSVLLRRLVAQARVCASSPSIQTPGPGTVEIIKRRPAFGATSGIRVGALYSRHYPPRKLGRDETAFLSPSSSHYLSLFLSLYLTVSPLPPASAAFCCSSCPSGSNFSSPCPPSSFGDDLSPLPRLSTHSIFSFRCTALLTRCPRSK